MKIKEMTPFEDFVFTSQILAKEMLDLIQKSINTLEKKELLERLDKVRIVVRELEFNPFYRQIKNKKELKEYRTTLKQLKAGCDKVEKAIMKGNVLYIF
jgi:soluble cytochrome b562